MAVAMMLDHLGERDAARCVEDAVARLIRTGRIESLQAGVHATDELGSMVEEAVRAHASV